ncbi:MAG TPA: hypothetical protein VKA21_12505 [Candidatus Binatia bacterium]|nr:hypothetical protein [Candidatus Binatia bacterium]
MRRVAVPVLVALVLAARAPAGAAPLERLEYRDDRLTLRAKGTPIGDVLDALRRESGAELRGEPPTGDVSATLDAVPLRDALERLLGEQSFTLTYGENGRLKAIQLKGGPLPALPPEPARAEPGVGGSDLDKIPHKWGAVLGAFNRGQKLKVHGRLRDLAGADTADWDFMLRHTHHDDPSIRAEAIHAAVENAEDDQGTRDALLEALRAMNDDELLTFIRALSRSIEEPPDLVLKEIVRASRNAEVRSRSRMLIRTIRRDTQTARGPA